MGKIVYSDNAWKDILDKGFCQPKVAANSSLLKIAEAVIAATEDHIASCPHIRAFIKSLPKGQGTFCPDSPLEELIKYAAKQNGQIDQSDPRINNRLATEFIAPIFIFKYRRLYEILINAPDLSSDEMWILAHSLHLPQLINELWGKWNQEMVIPYQLLSSAEQEEQKKIFTQALPEYDYTIFKVVNGQISKRRTWAQTWPDTIRRICEIYSSLARNIKDQASRNYFSAVRDAYFCTKIEELERYWRLVDEKWIKISHSQRIFTTHGIEKNYEHPVCVSPEFQIVIRTDDYTDIISQTHRQTKKYAQTLSERKIISENWLDSFYDCLENIDVGVFLGLTGAGYKLVSKGTGLLAPNRPEVRAKGAKVFIDKKNSLHSIAGHREKLIRYCEPESFAKLEKYLLPEFFAACTAGHEYGHIFGIQEDTDSKLGSHKYWLEEAKATAIGSLIVANLSSDYNNRLAVIAKTLARNLSFLQNDRLKRQTGQDYVRENLATANLLLLSGILELGENGLKIDFDDYKVHSFFGGMQTFIDYTLVAYKSGQGEYLKFLTENVFCQLTPEVEKLIAFINK